MDKDGMEEQAETLIKHSKQQQLPCKILMLENACKSSQPFINVIERAKIKSQHTAFRAPNTRLILVNPGSFIMGSPPDEAGRAYFEQEREVTLLHELIRELGVK